MQKGELRTAMPLTDDEKHRIEAHFADLFGEPVALAVRVDQSLLCGVCVTVGGKVYDSSARARLADVAKLLSEGGAANAE